MNHNETQTHIVTETQTRIITALTDSESSIRLRATLAAGSHGDSELLEILVDRCAVEPDFFVRDMLTWALTRHPSELTLPLLLAELASDRRQGRSQALHTLSKIGAPSTWTAITRDLLTDEDPDTAQSAWRAAVVLVPEGEEEALAQVLATQLGRGEEDLQRSLSRAMVALGEVIEPVLEQAARHAAPRVADHAVATQRLLADPDSAFTVSVGEAMRTRALASSPTTQDAPC